MPPIVLANPSARKSLQQAYLRIAECQTASREEADFSGWLCCVVRIAPRWTMAVVLRRRTILLENSPTGPHQICIPETRPLGTSLPSKPQPLTKRLWQNASLTMPALMDRNIDGAPPGSWPLTSRRQNHEHRLAGCRQRLREIILRIQ